MKFQDINVGDVIYRDDEFLLYQTLNITYGRQNFICRNQEEIVFVISHTISKTTQSDTLYCYSYVITRTSVGWMFGISDAEDVLLRI